MHIDKDLLERIVAHARADAPNECCGIVGVETSEPKTTAGSAGDGRAPRRALSVHAATNVAASPLRFEIDGLQVLKIIQQIEAEGLELGAIYHSHTRTEPYPSQTDINFAAGWPGVEWIIVGVADIARPLVRSYLIDGGKVEEVPI